MARSLSTTSANTIVLVPATNSSVSTSMRKRSPWTCLRTGQASPWPMPTQAGRSAAATSPSAVILPLSANSVMPTMLLNANTVEIVARNVAGVRCRACRPNTSGGPLVDSEVFSTPDTNPTPKSKWLPDVVRLMRAISSIVATSTAMPSVSRSTVSLTTLRMNRPSGMPTNAASVSRLASGRWVSAFRCQACQVVLIMPSSVLTTTASFTGRRGS